jgi:hypothetical protein
MSKSSYLARKVSLPTDLQIILSDCYLGDRQGKAKGGPDESSSPELLAEMCENCLGTIVHYWLHERVNAAELVGMPIFHVLIADTFAARRPGAAVLSNTKGAYRLEARALGLSLLASTVEELISIDQGRLLSRELLSRVVTADHFSAAATRDNLQVVTLAASTSAAHAGHMYDEGLIRVVLSDLETFTFPNEGMNQYCSSLIRNLALHEELVPGLLEQLKAFRVHGGILGHRFRPQRGGDGASSAQPLPLRAQGQQAAPAGRPKSPGHQSAHH